MPEHDDSAIMKALFKAITISDHSAVSIHVGSGVNLNRIDPSFEISALKRAIQWDNLEAVQLLLQHGADPNLGGYGLTPLGCAVDMYIVIIETDPEDDSLEIIDNLLLFGADPYQLGAPGDSAVQGALQCGYPAVAQRLEEHYSRYSKS